MKIFAVNGNWIEDAEHMGQTDAFQFGAGIFETIRIQGNQPLLWDAHMERLVASAAALGLSGGLDREQLAQWVSKLLQESAPQSCALKIAWVSNAASGKALFYLRPLGYTAAQRTQGLKASLGEIRRNPYSRVTAHKTLNYLDNLLERRAVRTAGYDEAILLNVWGEVAEGTATNVFIQREGVLVTPPTGAGILPGVQRKAIITVCQQHEIPIFEETITLEMLNQAEGIYLSNALMGFMPVSNFIGNCYDKDDSLVSRINRLTGIADEN